MKSGVYSERRAAKLIKQVLSCVDYFHSKCVVHRDLKPGSKCLEMGLPHVYGSKN